MGGGPGSMMFGKSNAKIYVRGVDLLCFDKINIADPEVYGVTYPLTRSVVAGLTIGF